MGEEALAGYLDEAARVFAAANGTHGQANVASGFDELRWFELPAVCLAHP